MKLHVERAKEVKELLEKKMYDEVLNIVLLELPLSSKTIVDHYAEIKDLKIDYDLLLLGEYEEADAIQKNRAIHQEMTVFRESILDFLD